MKDQFDAAAENGVLTKVQSPSLATYTVCVSCFDVLDAGVVSAWIDKKECLLHGEDTAVQYGPRLQESP